MLPKSPLTIEAMWMSWRQIVSYLVRRNGMDETAAHVKAGEIWARGHAEHNVRQNRKGRIECLVPVCCEENQIRIQL